MERKNVSRGTALLVAWLGCGLILPSYIGDKELARHRKKMLLRWLPWCFVGVGFVGILLCLLIWMLSDMLGCACGTLKYYDGTPVWRR